MSRRRADAFEAMTTTRHRAQKKKLGTSPEQLRRLLDVLMGTLDEPLNGTEIARRAHLGRFYFDHLVKAVLGESPAAFRRRLLLERAACQLLSSDRSVTFVALDAGYGSVEAFTHAFNRAYGTAPRDFRSRGETDHRLPAPNGVHFHPPGGGPFQAGEKRRRAMDLTDRMVEHDNWLTEQLLDAAEQLSSGGARRPGRPQPAQRRVRRAGAEHPRDAEPARARQGDVGRVDLGP